LQLNCTNKTHESIKTKPDENNEIERIKLILVLGTKNSTNNVTRSIKKIDVNIYTCVSFFSKK